MNNIKMKNKRFIRLDKRVRIELTTIYEYDTVKGYDAKLEYRVKNNLFNKYIWKTVNSAYIPCIFVSDGTELNEHLKKLMNRRVEKSNVELRLMKKLSSSIINTWKNY